MFLSGKVKSFLLSQRTPQLYLGKKAVYLQGDGNREMRFFDQMERIVRLLMDEEESRPVDLPVIDESTA